MLVTRCTDKGREIESPSGDDIKCSGVRGEGNREVHTMDVILVRSGVPIGKERVERERGYRLGKGVDNSLSFNLTNRKRRK